VPESVRLVLRSGLGGFEGYGERRCNQALLDPQQVGDTLLASEAIAANDQDDGLSHQDVADAVEERLLVLGLVGELDLPLRELRRGKLIERGKLLVGTGVRDLADDLDRSAHAEVIDDVDPSLDSLERTDQMDPVEVLTDPPPRRRLELESAVWIDVRSVRESLEKRKLRRGRFVAVDVHEGVRDQDDPNPQPHEDHRILHRRTSVTPRSILVTNGVRANRVSHMLPQARMSTYTRGMMKRVVLACTLLMMAASVSIAAASDVWVLTIDSEIRGGTVSYLRSGFAAAESAGAKLVVILLATPGGELDAAFAARDLILDSRLPTLAFVDREALSAGALLAIACETILFAPGGIMGAATPVTFDLTGNAAEASEKVQSAVRTLFRATAEVTGRDPLIAEAMVDVGAEIPGLIEAGKLLTLTAQEAATWGYSDGEATSLDALLEARGYALAQAEAYESRLIDRIVETMTSTALAAILLVVGLLGLIIEMMVPGFGIAGVIGALCLGAFFWAHFLVGLAGWESLVFLIGGLLAVFFEIFVFTAADFGFAGIVGLILIGLGFYTSMVGPFTDRAAALRAIGVVSAGVVFAVIAGVVLISRLPKSKLRMGGVILSTAITGRASNRPRDPDAASAWIGRRGVAVTDLHPVGAGMFDDERIDVVCEEGHLPKGTPLVIVVDDGYRKVVRRAKED